MASVTGDRPNVWRGVLLKELISAQVELDTNYNLDSTLNLLFEMDSKRRKANRETPIQQGLDQHKICDIRFLSLTSSTARVFQFQSIFCEGAINTDPRLVDLFIQWTQASHQRTLPPSRTRPERTGARKQSSLVRAMLHHPLQPTQIPAPEFLREVQADKANDFWKLESLSQLQRILAACMTRMYYVAEGTGHVKDAAWVKQSYEPTFKQGFPKTYWEDRKVGSVILEDVSDAAPRQHANQAGAKAFKRLRLNQTES